MQSSALVLTLSLIAAPAQEPARAAQDAPGEAAPPVGETVARPARELDDRYLRTAFLDIYGRPPFQAERERWLGEGFHLLLERLLESPEFWRHWYDEQLYHFLLIDNFGPESERVTAIPSELGAGRLDVRQALHRIAISASFDRRNPGADTFVTVVMEQLGGIRVQKKTRELEIGKRLYDGGDGVFLGRSGHSQADVVDITIHSRQFAQTLLEREYRRYLHSEPDARELRRWVTAFMRDPRCYLALVRTWLLSDTYGARLAQPVPLTNRLFVRALFVDLMDRLPEDEEAEPLREALDGLSDSEPLRSVLARLLLESGRVPVPAKDSIEDPTAWVAGLFRRLLGRDATPAELKSFVQAFYDPAARPETLIYALLSAPEYHVH